MEVQQDAWVLARTGTTRSGAVSLPCTLVAVVGVRREQPGQSCQCPCLHLHWQRQLWGLGIGGHETSGIHARVHSGGSGSTRWRQGHQQPVSIPTFTVAAVVVWEAGWGCLHLRECCQQCSAARCLLIREARAARYAHISSIWVTQYMCTYTLVEEK